MRRAIQRATREQVAFINSTAPFPAFVGGFGSGKTEALIKRCIKGKLKYPSLNRAYYLPTYDLVKQIGFPRFEEALTDLGLQYKLNISDKHITVWHKGQSGRIIFRTLDKPERIIGYEVADSDVDELDTLPTAKAEDAWNKIIARNRQKKPDGTQNTVGVGTTPEGFRFVYKKWEKERTESYALIHATTQSNQRNLPDDYIEKLEETYTSQLLDAYLKGKFVNLTSGTVYPSFNRKLNHTDEVDTDGEHLHIGMDFNVYKMSAIVHVERAGLPIAVNELTGIRDTPAMITALKERYPGRKITVYPDASGVAAKTTNASTSDIALLKAAFDVCAPYKNPLVRNRVMAMNAMFLNAAGDRRYKVNTTECPEYTASLEQQVYGKDGSPDKQNDHDHTPDAGGYYINFKYPVQQRAQVRIR
jgi:hypothetical protein